MATITLYPSPSLTANADYEQASVYHRLQYGSAQFSASAATTLYFRLDTTSAPSAALGAFTVFHLDPADYPAGSKTTYLRLSMALFANDVAPTVNFTSSMYPVTAVAGGAAANTFTPGSVIAASQVAINTPAADSLNYATTSDFAFPTAGYYVLGCTVSGQMAASSAVVVRVVLSRRAT